jgi:hypothetical protein
MLIVFSAFFLTLFVSILVAFLMQGLVVRDESHGPLHSKLRQNVLKLSTLYRIKADE